MHTVYISTIYRLALPYTLALDIGINTVYMSTIYRVALPYTLALDTGMTTGRVAVVLTTRATYIVITIDIS